MFKDRIATALKYSKYNQHELSELLNISEGNITNWKNGANFPSLEVFFKLCILLDESADFLLGLEDESGNKIEFPNDITEIDL
jgi:transcriptional regulator with XRE-family HTH domain